MRPSSRRPCHCSCLIVLALITCFNAFAHAASYEKVSDIGSAMWTEMKYTGGCYKLLNSTGAIGSEAPSSQPVTGILAYYDDVAGGLTADRVVVTPVATLDALLQQVLSDAAFAKHVKGVLVDPRDIPASHSSAPKFPGAAYAPYANVSGANAYPWNPAGSGMSRQHFPFPVFIMGWALAQDTVWRAKYNHGLDWLNAAYHRVDMQLTMSAVGNSSYCMYRGSCQPVGGYSTWTSIPPLNGSRESTRPVTLVIAQVDSNGLFHDVVQAADGPISGLIAMLAALQILVRANQSSTYTRTLAFAAITGEPWDYMGSRRLLWEMDLGTDVTKGLNISDIDQVIEIGQVGKASPGLVDSVAQLYVHSQRGAGYGDVSALQASLGLAAAQTNETNVTFSSASASNPGIPPSSLMSFLRVKPSIAGVVITEFDTQFTNRFYQSEFDFPNNTASAGMVATAIALARSLHLLATGNNASAPKLEVSLSQTQSFVSHLFQCLAQDDPGMACALARPLITPGYVSQDGVTSFAVRHYIGVLSRIPADPQDPYLRSDVFRFLYNLMGTLTAIGEPGPPCAPREALCGNASQVCIGWKSGTSNPATMGRCLNTTVFYVPAVSTKFWFSTTSQFYGWVLTNESYTWERRYGWPEDPMWTESNWPETTPDIRVYQSEAYSVEVAVIVSGVLLTVATGVASYIMKAAYERQLKSQ